jgi:sugar phosphate permease
MIYVVCGLLSTIIGGIASDRLSVKNPMAKSWVCLFGNALGLPCLVLSCMITNNFWLSMSFFAGKVLFGENWYSPAITMV